jgi:hypothetical protein
MRSVLRCASILAVVLVVGSAWGQQPVAVPELLQTLRTGGKDWFDVREGEASIFKPDGERYSLVGRVQIGQWATAR